MVKAFRRVIAAVTVAVLAFRAVGSFLSWIEHQEDTAADTWIDEDEFEEIIDEDDIIIEGTYEKVKKVYR